MALRTYRAHTLLMRAKDYGKVRVEEFAADNRSAAELIYRSSKGSPAPIIPDGDGDNDDKGLPPSPRDLDLWKTRGRPEKSGRTRPVEKSRPKAKFPHLLTDEEIAAILFNEMRSLSGPGIEQAYRNLIHVVLNGEEQKGSGRPDTARTKTHVPPAEKKTYEKMKEAVRKARAEHDRGIDPTGGANHFNFRNGPSRNNWRGTIRIKTQTGPMENSYPTGELGKDDIYFNTYEEE